MAGHGRPWSARAGPVRNRPKSLPGGSGGRGQLSETVRNVYQVAAGEVQMSETVRKVYQAMAGGVKMSETVRQVYQVYIKKLADPAVAPSSRRKLRRGGRPVVVNYDGPARRRKVRGCWTQPLVFCLPLERQTHFGVFVPPICRVEITKMHQTPAKSSRQ